jgi:hypothetical protein
MPIAAAICSLRLFVGGQGKLFSCGQAILLFMLSSSFIFESSSLTTSMFLKRRRMPISFLKNTRLFFLLISGLQSIPTSLDALGLEAPE